MPARIALVGDYSPSVLAHRAIPHALALARDALAAELDWTWVATRDVRDATRELAGFAAIWVVPNSPYENMAGVLAAIRFARETRRPFLGTCGGFQHALIEYAQDVAGLAAADHAETNPTGEMLVVAPLACSLVETSATVRFTPGSRLQTAYGTDAAVEGYHCRYGLNPAHRTTLERAGLHFTAVDDSGAVRAAELPGRDHPFFVGTLFQPERAALRQRTPPLVQAFAAATLQSSVTL